VPAAKNRPSTSATCSPAPRELALALEERAHSLALAAESAVELAFHAEGQPVFLVSSWLVDLHKAADLAEGVADRLWAVLASQPSPPEEGRP
jgi:hypothetical protein